MGTVVPEPREYTAPPGRQVLYTNVRMPASLARYQGSASQLEVRTRVDFPG